ncbi:MAG TPA: hypothetical protein VMV10_26315 [Pirellulales bacterium]|nr:hypothetical protein [Pirellulales bacterium]
MAFNSLRIAATCVLAAIAAASCPDVSAQVLVQRVRNDTPAVNRIFPAGVQRGRTVEIVANGERLEGLSGILGPPGLRLAKVISVGEKEAKLELQADADAPPGIHAIHLLSKAGLSNPKLLAIDAWPQATEQEPNNLPAEANAVKAPVGVCGVLEKTDVDYYRLEAAAGERLVFEVEARRLGSSTFPVLTLYDATGRTLHRDVTLRGARQEAHFEYVFPAAGTYLLRVHEQTYQGSAASVYRLRIGPIPFAARMFPLGGQRGVKTPVTFSGGSLPQPVVYEVDLTGEIAWRRRALEIPYGDDVLVAPALFAVGEHPEAFEQEPNDAAEQAQPVAAPVTLNGCIEKPGDRDCVRFHAKQGEKLTIRVLAQQLGSPLDSTVVILDSTGKELLAADDRPLAPREAPAVRPAAPPPLLDDVLAEFAAPGEGDYVLAIEDRYGHGGQSYAYRLELAPAIADFELVVQPGLPSNPRDPKAAQQRAQVLNEFTGAGAGALSMDRGGTGTILVRAFRNGYTGPIALSVEGLPAGVQASPATIAAGQNDATLNLVADFDASSTAAWVRIVGRGEIEGGAQGPAQSFVRLAEHAVVWSALAGCGAAAGELPALALGVSQQGAELAVRGMLAGVMTPGASGTLHVAVKRREGYAGDVTIELLNLPAGLSASPAVIAADRNEADLQLAAAPDLTPGKHVLLVAGTLKLADRKEPIKAEFPLEFEAFPPVAVHLAAQQIEVPQGGTAKVELQLHHYASLVVPIELTVSQLPRGLSAADASIPPDAERFELTIQAADSAAASPIRRIVQIKAKTKIGQHVIELPTLRFALKVVRRN